MALILGVIERIGREMTHNTSPVFESLVSYIILNYKDEDYEEKCKLIEVVAFATKGGASNEELLKLCKDLNLDKIKVERDYDFINSLKRWIPHM